MGKYDSSKTRVMPVFNKLFEKDRTGISWLIPLMRLANRSEIVQEFPIEVTSLKKWGWGASEIALEPSHSLLKWLICHVDKDSVMNQHSSKQTFELRMALANGNAVVREKALNLIQNLKVTKKAWYIFEGKSYPDVYLETDELILVIEGKRTEQRPTTSTTWMPVRHQILRHFDGAWEVRKGKNVYGMFIVEGSGNQNCKEIPPQWLDAVNQTVSDEVLEKSLPHRTKLERQEIAQKFLGVTTWQNVCGYFGIDWNSLPVII